MRWIGLNFLALSTLLAVGCSDQTTQPSSEVSWDWIRLHEAGAGTYSDLSIGADGEFALDTSSRGEVSPARGLLAGERLETLARVIGELPLESYSSEGPCDGSFFLSVTRDGDVTTYRANACDDAVPAPLVTARRLLSEFVTGIDDPQRPDPGAARVLLSGTSTGIRAPGQFVLENRDEFMALLREHRPGGIVALPPVDFGEEVVVGIVESRPTGGYTIGLGSVGSGESGWRTVQILSVVPGDGCVVTPAGSEPFLLIAVKRSGDGVILDRRTEVQRCG